MELKQHLTPKRKLLRLSGILDTLDVRTRQAVDEQWSYGDFLERLLEDPLLYGLLLHDLFFQSGAVTSS